MYRDLTKRIIALALSICMIAGMVDLSGLIVHAEDIEDVEEDYTIRDAESFGDIKIDDADLVYDGEPKKPGVTIDGVSESKYTVTYHENTYATIPGINQPHVTITNNDEAEDTVDVPFTIKPRNIEEDTENCKVEPSNLDQVIVDWSKPVTPEVVLKYKGIEVNPSDYRRTYTNNTESTCVDGKAYVRIEGQNNFTGSITIEFTITLLESGKLDFEFAEILTNGWNYGVTTPTAGAKPGIKNVTYEEKALPTGSKYEVHYEDYTRAGTAKAWIEITDGPYKGLTSKSEDGSVREPHTFKIVKPMNQASLKEHNIYLGKDIPTQPYACDSEKNMTLKEEDLVFVDPDYLVSADPDYPDGTLKLGRDYTITSCKVTDYNPVTGKGTGKVEVTGKGYYKGVKSETFEIKAPKLTDQLIDKTSIPTCTYDVIDSNGTEKRWYDVVAAQLKVKSGDVVYEPGEDYTIAPLNEDYGTQAGKEHKLRLTSTGTGKLKAGDYVDVTYEVKPRSLSEVGIELENYTDYVYDGTEKCPKVRLTYMSRETGGRKTLTKDIDYVPRYASNTNATVEAKAYAEGMGNFTGETSRVNFKILPIDLTDSKLVEITGFEENQSFTYTGNEITPSMNVVYDQKTLKPEDYTVSYASNVNVGEEGEAEVTIFGTGNYTGKFTKHFTVVPLDLNDERVVSVDPLKDEEYTGGGLEPAVTVRHSTKKEPLVSGDENSGDYYVRYSDNINVSVPEKKAKATITGRGNYTGTKVVEFVIGKRRLSSGTLKVSHQESGEVLEPVPEGNEHYHRYTGEEILEGFDIELSFPDKEGKPITNALIWDKDENGNGDYTLRFDNHQDVGTALVTIVPNPDGNYTGTYTMQFKIKGNLSDSYAKVTIPDQTYTSKKIEPANAEVTFETISGIKKLIPDIDYVMECDNNVSAGTNTAKATFRGKEKGNYYDETTAMFTILPFNLSEPDPEGNEYLIDMAKEYTFCDTNVPIHPEPVITHNGTPLIKGINDDYYIVYGPDSVNSNVGTGSLTVKSTSGNYIGEREATFEILPYDIAAGEAEAEPHVIIEGFEENVILDKVLDNPEGNAAVKIENGKVVMSNLKVMYKAVDLEGTEYAARELKWRDEYTVSYEANDKIGEATITIQGRGNFTGTITKTFRIRGDLSSKDRTQVSVENCIYNPTGNTPEPSVVYTYRIPGSAERTKTLEAGIDYEVDYDNNTDATVKSGAPAKVIIKPVYDESDPTVIKGDFAQSEEEPKSEEFLIEQRDLTDAVKTEENEKDELLNVTGLIEDGYEYNGFEIVPDLQITCAGKALAPAGEDNLGDYKISAENNLDVYTFEKDENGELVESGNGELNRLMPVVTVEAVKGEDGNYNGNYKGGFQMEFKINPRQISADTIDSVLWVNGRDYNDSQIPEVDYTNGDPITFPLVDPEEPENVRNDMTVTWRKDGQKTDLKENQDYKISYEDNRRIGEAKIIVSHVANSNYEGEYTRIFKIMASISIVDEPDESRRYISLYYEPDVPFGIVPVYPDMIFTDTSGGQGEDPYILKIKDEFGNGDFEIVTEANKGDAEEVSRNNVNVADKDAENEEDRPMVVIRGIGCYRGTIKRYYTIVPKNLTTDQGDITADFGGTYPTEDYENAYIYTGQAIEPGTDSKLSFVVKNHGVAMKLGDDYEIVDYDNNTEISEETKRASVTIKAADGSNYEGQKTFYFDIIPRQIDSMQAELVGASPVYNRKAQTPDVEVSYTENGKKVVLEKNKDYTVAYENNTNAATAGAGAGAPVIIITGKGSYGGTLRKTFTIERELLNEPLEGEIDDFIITTEDVYYTGEAVTTKLVVKTKDGKLLLNESDIPETPDDPDDPDEPETVITPDYRIAGYRNNVNAGIGYVTIEGLGNYTGRREVSFNIIAPDKSEDFRIDDVPAQTYTGSPIKPEPRVWLEIDGEEKPLVDYEFEYKDNISAGTATLILRGTGNYGGKKEVNFTILPKSIGTVDDGMSADMMLAAIEDQIYTGRGITPDVQLTDRIRAAAQTEGEESRPGLLVAGKDYTLSYLTNVFVGTASIVITGIGNYTGNIQTQFRIIGSMELADVARIDAQPYTGSEVRPKPAVSFAGKTLTEGEDYTLTYEDNIAQGTAKIIITGIGEWYTGQKTVTFDIARDLSNETLVKGLAASYTYTGKQIAPALLVEDHGRILSKGKDYRASYSNNVNVGTATVTITGMGSYNGTVTAQFKITPQNIGRADVSSIADQVYDGKDKTPSVSVSNAGIALKGGTDYTIVHVDNKNPGKASVVIKGVGNYTGTKTVNYNIIVPMVTGVKASAYTSSSITFSWEQNSVVSGYEIYNSKNRRVAFVRKNSTLKATVSKLQAGTTETFRVRAYVNRGQYYYSDFVSINAGTATKAAGITSITSKKPKQVTIKWKKVAGATKYQIYRSTKAKGKYKRIATTKKTSYTDKKATGGKTYYYKIRVCKQAGSKMYYSKYSTIKSVAAKK